MAGIGVYDQVQVRRALSGYTRGNAGRFRTNLTPPGSIRGLPNEAWHHRDLPATGSCDFYAREFKRRLVSADYAQHRLGLQW